MFGQQKRWSVRGIAAAIYPLAAGAVAVNLFFLSLMAQAIGLSALDPWTAVLVSLPLGIPAAVWFAGRMRRLMDEADRR